MNNHHGFLQILICVCAWKGWCFCLFWVKEECKRKHGAEEPSLKSSLLIYRYSRRILWRWWSTRIRNAKGSIPNLPTECAGTTRNIIRTLSDKSSWYKTNPVSLISGADPLIKLYTFLFQLRMVHRRLASNVDDLLLYPKNPTHLHSIHQQRM